MVDKITIFEPHFDGAQFGPASIPGDVLPGGEHDADDEPAELPAIEADVEAEDVELDAAESGGKRISVGPLAVLAVALVGGALLARRRLGRRAADVDPVD